MRLTFGNVLFLVLVVAGVAFAAAPWFAFRSLRDAARTGDTQALAQLVDYNAVRHGIADQLSDQPAAAQAPAPDIWHDPLGALKHVFSAPPAPPQPQIDTYLSPNALAALADGRPPRAGAAPQGHEPFPMVLFWGPDRARIGVTDPGPPVRRAEFTLTRHGFFSWKVTRIVLPRAVGARA